MRWEKVLPHKLAAATEENNPNFHILRGFFSLLPVAAFIADKKGRLLFLNEHAQREWKTRREIAIGRTIASLIGNRQLERELADCTACALREMSGCVSSHISEDPHLFTLIFPVTDSNGEVLVAGLVVKTNG